MIVEVAIAPLPPTVPDLTGLDLGPARRQIRAEGFTSTHVFVDSNNEFVQAANSADAVVVRQDPAPGTVGEAGTTVNIVLQLQE